MYSSWCIFTNITYVLKQSDPSPDPPVMWFDVDFDIFTGQGVEHGDRLELFDAIDCLRELLEAPLAGHVFLQ